MAVKEFLTLEHLRALLEEYSSADTRERGARRRELDDRLTRIERMLADNERMSSERIDRLIKAMPDMCQANGLSSALRSSTWHAKQELVQLIGTTRERGDEPSQVTITGARDGAGVDIEMRRVSLKTLATVVQWVVSLGAIVWAAIATWSKAHGK